MRAEGPEKPMAAQAQTIGQNVTDGWPAPPHTPRGGGRAHLEAASPYARHGTTAPRHAPRHHSMHFENVPPSIRVTVASFQDECLRRQGENPVLNRHGGGEGSRDDFPHLSTSRSTYASQGWSPRLHVWTRFEITAYRARCACSGGRRTILVVLVFLFQYVYDLSYIYS